MIEIIESHLHSQTVTAVVEANRSPPKILSLHKGTFTDHDVKCATYHAKKSHQEAVKVFKQSGRATEISVPLAISDDY